ncbi:M48 family metallopeptidase [Mangrovibacterium diazotrophicum]|uniref:Peptidase M48-like protein n=1 Tax=Mangrovibacterium diazotrophicum TaxID=1261403 RepID=A0A419VY97_9BACT|nr:M48 family metallopeptidase [Mangrovibacterium diazotrophicum]RKD88213.1 peptidase M48-like protein [Mangrovibacterium diazotrophicum]
MKRRTKLSALTGCLLVAAALFLHSCQSVPLTGRSQLSLIPESDMVSMSLTNYDEFLKENKLSTNKQQTEMVKRVGAKMAAAVEKYLRDNGFGSYVENFKWEFNLVDSDVPNAWCMPGGKVVVYTGILPYTQDESGLAVVMGHEIAHAVARHGNERMSHAMLVQMGGVALSTAVQEKPEETKALYNMAYGATTQVGVMLPFSRKHEYEADQMGLIFMAIAGYDPRSAVAFWQRMSANSGGTPEWLSTHPVDQNRIAALEKQMPEALKYYSGQ